jgi:hypothetical protein
MRICFVVIWAASCLGFTGCGHKKTETIELSLKEATGVREQDSRKRSGSLYLRQNNLIEETF